MALPNGSFSLNAAGISGAGGAFTYDAGSVRPQYYAGTFFIDTGYDDPVVWTTGVDAAEVYQGRVYASSGTHFVGQPAGTYTGKWLIAATPVWTAKHWAVPHSNQMTQQRIWLKCDVYLTEPFSTSSGTWFRMDAVDWSLYRV